MFINWLQILSQYDTDLIEFKSDSDYIGFQVIDLSYVAKEKFLFLE